jgi:hypothetical protein
MERWVGVGRGVRGEALLGEWSGDAVGIACVILAFTSKIACCQQGSSYL